jgi:hypothetical protein
MTVFLCSVLDEPTYNTIPIGLYSIGNKKLILNGGKMPEEKSHT